MGYLEKNGQLKVGRRNWETGWHRQYDYESADHMVPITHSFCSDLRLCVHSISINENSYINERELNHFLDYTLISSTQTEHKTTTKTSKHFLPFEVDVVFKMKNRNDHSLAEAQKKTYQLLKNWSQQISFLFFPIHWNRW